MQAAMEAQRNDPGHYNLFLNNCAQFVESVFMRGGVAGLPHCEVSAQRSSAEFCG
jgi:hypothetical protein